MILPAKSYQPRSKNIEIKANQKMGSLILLSSVERQQSATLILLQCKEAISKDKEASLERRIIKSFVLKKLETKSEVKIYHVKKCSIEKVLNFKTYNSCKWPQHFFCFFEGSLQIGTIG